MLRKMIRGGLQHLDLLDRLQYNNAWRTLRSSAFRDVTQRQFTFYSTLLPGDCGMVFDIGANVGDHTRMFLKLSRRVVCVEPDLRNHEILQKRFGRNRRVEILNKAVSASAGIATFYIEEEGSAFNTLSPKWVDILGAGEKSRFEPKAFVNSRTVETLTLDGLVAAYGTPDFVKIDVEGMEKEIICGLSHSLPLLGLECNLPEFLEETIFIVERLAQLDGNCRFNYAGPGQLVLREYVTSDAMVHILRSTELRFMDLYCKGATH